MIAAAASAWNSCLRLADPLEDLDGQGREGAERRRVERHVRERRRSASAGPTRRWRATARGSIPVTMPGQRRRQHRRGPTCQRVAPRASRPGGSSRARPAAPRATTMITVGSTSSARIIAPASSDPPEAEAADEEREPEDAVDDRRHAGQVRDVQLEEPVVPAVLLANSSSQIAVATPTGTAIADHQAEQPDRREDCGPGAGLVGVRRRWVGTGASSVTNAEAVDQDRASSRSPSASTPTASETSSALTSRENGVLACDGCASTCHS